MPAFASAQAADIPPADGRAIAREACSYGSAMMDSHRIMHGDFVDREHPEYKTEAGSSRNENQ